MDISLKNKYRIPKIQSTELKKVIKLMDPREDASVPLGREKKVITSWGGGGAPGREPDLVSRERTEALRGNRKNGNRQPQEVGGWGHPPECTRDLGSERLLGLKRKDLI